MFDLIVIGAGPGGYVAAIRASQLGLKVALVEKSDHLGGTCLNVGCIPSKALLSSTEHFKFLTTEAENHGIIAQDIRFDLAKMMGKKTKVVSDIRKGLNYLMTKNTVTVYNGAANFVDSNTLNVNSKSGDTIELQAKNFIIATGSVPIDFPFLKFDSKKVISSTEALSFETVPENLVIVGAGVIGLELGSVYARLGSKVDVIEYMDQCLPNMDKDIRKEMQKSLSKQGINFHFEHKVKGAEYINDKLKITAETSKEEKYFDADYCLIAAGRKPNTNRLNLEQAKVEVDHHGFIKVDDSLRTTSPNIFAIGDVIGQPMLAHKSEEEGVFVAETITGQKPHIDYNLIPSIVYTSPEIASVGSTEEDLIKKGIKYKMGKCPFQILGRAKASGETEGFVKILAHPVTDQVLGAHIVGSRASDLIMEVAALMEFKASSEDIARICHGHPTFSEAIKEAALAATENRAIHM